MRIVVVASHPIQYQAPLFRELAQRTDLHVLFAHQASEQDQSNAGFGVGFAWDSDLFSCYDHTFLRNVAQKPNLEHFAGCDTPSILTELARLKPDAVVLMGWHLKCYWQAIWAAKRAGIPTLVRSDSQLKTPRSIVKRAVKSIVYPTALRVFDAALYVGEHSYRYWQHYGYPANRLFFSPHCIDNDWFASRATPLARSQMRAAHGIAPSAKVVLFAGKLLPFKRPLDVIEGAARAEAAVGDLIVLVAGSGPLGERMTQAASTLGVSLVHLGFYNQTEMPLAYAAADLLVLPSDGRETVQAHPYPRLQSTLCFEFFNRAPSGPNTVDLPRG